jgi:hypothetical protein
MCTMFEYRSDHVLDPDFFCEHDGPWADVHVVRVSQRPRVLDAPTSSASPRHMGRCAFRSRLTPSMMQQYAT